jgi:hypothetical protein
MRIAKQIAAIMSETNLTTLFFADQTHVVLSPQDVVLKGDSPTACEDLRPDDVIVCEEGTTTANNNYVPQN